MINGRLLTRFNILLALALAVCVAFGLLRGLPARLALIMAVAVAAVTVAAPFAIRLARAAGAIDVPGGRRIHSRPTPRWGGLAVGFGVFLALLSASSHYMPNLRALLAGSFLMLLVGAIDDVRPVKAWVRLMAQSAACLMLIVDGVVISVFPPAGFWVIVRWAVTFLWIVGVTNAVNFMDGMDGLVSSWAIVACSIYCVLALLLGRNMLAYCSVALMGGALGFLAFNVKPARMFLGDCGSSFFGFFLAALSMQGNWSKDNPLVSFCVPILVLSVPIYDMVFTTIERIASGKVTSLRSWLEYTGRDHLHHRLEALGLSRSQVVLVICFLSMAVGLSAIAIYESATYVGLTLIIQTICVYGVFALLELLGREKARRSGQACE